MGITKEVLQGIFYFLIYCCCIKNRFIKSKFLKVFLGSIILFASALFFREYYLLVSFFTMVVFIIFELMKNRNCTKKRKLFIIVLFFVATMFCFMFVAKIYFPNEYEFMVNLRSYSYKYLSNVTDSFIHDIIENNSSNLYIYILNYWLNFMRIIFPIEMILVGKFYYIPFIIYQIWFTGMYIEKLIALSEVNTKKYLSLIFLTSFLLVSAMMEPDFSSWARHQTVCFYMVCELFVKNNN